MNLNYHFELISKIQKLSYPHVSYLRKIITYFKIVKDEFIWMTTISFEFKLVITYIIFHRTFCQL